MQLKTLLVGFVALVGGVLCTQQASGQIMVPPEPAPVLTDVLADLTGKDAKSVELFSGTVDGIGNFQTYWSDGQLHAFVDGHYITPMLATYESDWVQIAGQRPDQTFLVVELSLNAAGNVQIETSDENGYDGTRITLQAAAQPERDKCVCKRPRPGVQTDRVIDCTNAMCSTGDDCTFRASQGVTQCHWLQGGQPRAVISAPVGAITEK